MKTKEERKTIKEEMKALNEKLSELTEDELLQVTGGAAPEDDLARRQEKMERELAEHLQRMKERMQQELMEEANRKQQIEYSVR